MGNRWGFVACAVAAMAPGCSSSDDTSGGTGKGSYTVTVLTTQAEVGEVLGFNNEGLAVTEGATHGLAIIDTHTKVVQPLSPEAEPRNAFVGIDDDGDVLYRIQGGRFRLWHAERRDEVLPNLTDESFAFGAFALAAHGVVWGMTSKARPGDSGLPGVGAMKDGKLIAFRDLAVRPLKDRWSRRGLSANEAGQLLFCDADLETLSGNGFQPEECFVLQADGTVTELNAVYKDSFRTSALGMNARGEVIGDVLYGQDGLGGSYGFLYSAPTGYRLGDEFGASVRLSDAGDAVYVLTKTPRQVLLRRANGDKILLNDYLRSPVNPNAEVNEKNVVGLNAAGEILIIDGSANLALLTPR